MLDVCLLGTAGMMPLPHRYLTAFMTRYNGSSLLIDCGEGTQMAVRKKGWSANPIDVICFTHYHADHISGLPGMLLSMANADRTEPVVMIGPRGLEYVASHLRVIAPELPFSVIYEEIEEPEEDFVLSGYHIHAFRVNHNVTCYGYVIEIPRAGRFDAEAAKRLGIPLSCWNPLQKGKTMTVDGKTYTPDMVMGPDRKGIKVAYVTDTRPTKGIVEAVRGADLFVCEGMYGDREKASDAKKKKHMTFYEAARMAKDAEVEELWLTHFSPSMIGPERYMDDVKKIFNNSKLGKDGKSKTIVFAEEDS